MAQADGVVANGTGSAVRADINGQLAALFTNHSGSTEPATTFAFQTWADTNTSTLKLRNSSNDGWIQLARLDGQFDAKTFNGNITLNAQSDLRLADSDSSNWVAFQAPATVANNVTWTLPAADGTSGQTLQTNGSGTLSWSTPSATVDKIEEGNTSAEVVDTGSDGHFKVVTEGTEALRVDANQNLLITTDTQRSAVIHTNAKLQLENTSVTRAAAQIVLNSNDANGCGLILGKTRGTSNGSNTSVSSGDTIGNIFFQAADGSELRRSALIKGEIDGTPGSADMPGRLVFATTPDGSAVPAERLRIGSTGAFGIAGANYGTSGQVLTSQGSGSAPQWATPAESNILQIVATKSNYRTTFTNVIPFDGTEPTSSEGVEIQTVSITPKSSSSNLLVEWACGMASATGGSEAIQFGMWADSDTNPSHMSQHMVYPSDHSTNVIVRVTIPNAGTSTRTMRIRAGVPSGATGAINRRVGGNYYNAATYMVFTVIEYTT